MVIGAELEQQMNEFFKVKEFKPLKKNESVYKSLLEGKMIQLRKIEPGRPFVNVTKINKPFILIDGNNMMHRYYNALRNLKSKTGLPSGGIYGVLKGLLGAKKKSLVDCSRLIVVFDPSPTDVDEMKTIVPVAAPIGYKSNRKPQSHDFYAQMHDLKLALSYLNVNYMSAVSIEADLLIGLLSGEAATRYKEVSIWTTDSDFIQLIRKNVFVYNLKDKLTFTEESNPLSGDRLPPRAIIDIKAIAGDPTDNLKGVFGVGSAGVCDVLRAFNDSILKLYKAEPVFPLFTQFMPHFMPDWSHSKSKAHPTTLELKNGRKVLLVVDVLEEIIQSAILCATSKGMSVSFFEKMLNKIVESKMDVLENYAIVTLPIDCRGLSAENKKLIIDRAFKRKGSYNSKEFLTIIDKYSMYSLSTMVAEFKRIDSENRID